MTPDMKAEAIAAYSIVEAEAHASSEAALAHDADVLT